MPRKGPKPSRKGTYYVLMPLDIEILKRLPDEGAMVGYHHLARSVKSLVEEMEDGGVTGALLNGRLRAMALVGYVVARPIAASGGAMGWQRTAAGKTTLTEKEGK